MCGKVSGCVWSEVKSDVLIYFYLGTLAIVANKASTKDVVIT